MKKILFLSLVIIILLSCENKPEPSGSFQYDFASDFSPVTVTFIANYDNADSYSWNFGDLGSAYGQTVTHQYQHKGTYTVTLNTSGEGGDKEEKKTIVIPDFATKMSVNRIDVLRFPNNNPDGKSWDSFPDSGPDIFVIAGTENDTVYAQSTNYRDDAIAGKAYQFDIDYTFTEFDKRFFVNIYDIDPASYEFVGGLIGSINHLREEDYPESFEMTLDDISLMVYVTWE